MLQFSGSRNESSDILVYLQNRIHEGQYSKIQCTLLYNYALRQSFGVGTKYKLTRYRLNLLLLEVSVSK
jgi:hypothetical protein